MRILRVEIDQYISAIFGWMYGFDENVNYVLLFWGGCKEINMKEDLVMGK